MITPGAVRDWPWGQEPAEFMLDPCGHMAGPLADPQGWIAAHRSNIERAIEHDGDGEVAWIEGGADVSVRFMWGWIAGAAGVVLAAAALIADKAGLIG